MVWTRIVFTLMLLHRSILTNFWKLSHKHTMQNLPTHFDNAGNCDVIESMMMISY